MTHVLEIRDLDSLQAYRLLWRSLLDQTSGATFFQAADWLEVYWRHFGHEQQLRVLVVRACGEVLGILPLAVRPRKTRLGTLRVLTYPLDYWGNSYGPIGRQPAATLMAGLGHIARAPRDWDVVDLRWVNGSVDRGRTCQALRCAGLSASPSFDTLSPCIELTGRWSEYWQARPKRVRRNLPRCQRKLLRDGQLEFIRHRPAPAASGDGDPRWDLYDACERLAGRTWQANCCNGTTLSSKTVRPFLRDVHAAAARAGAIDISLLKLNGMPIAFSYGYHWAGQVSLLRMGYHPTMRAYGPGSVLTALQIEDSYERGDRQIDLGCGANAWKLDWQTQVEQARRYTHFPATAPVAQLVRLGRWLQRRFAAGERAALGTA